ncbi:MAG: polysaccharide biosynthesis/export family protein [Bacteroidaceae bacterium]|nr:polysaccharide biosynthesis/export family protein [Bacteroidaceae bacterium]
MTFLFKMKFLRFFLLSCLIFGLTACTSSKKILYFQNLDDAELKPLTTEYEAVIKKDDRLTIVVSGPDKLVCAPYNLTLNEMSATGGGTGSNPETATLSYLVDRNGDIEFPILGKIHVEGMTRNDLVNYLTEEIGKDVKDPIVYVAFRNYKITILGEVRSPGTYTIDSEKINILQALGRAGDLNLTAQRQDILLLREVDGVLTHHRIDLRDKDILESPYFYLQQNDVIYVAPSATRVATATTATGIWSVILSSITTMIAIIGFLSK